MHSISGQFGEFLIGPDAIPANHVNVVADHDEESARNALHSCAHNATSMDVLRRLVDQQLVGHPARRMNDLEIIDRAARLVAGGWLKMATFTLPPLKRGGGKEKGEQPAPRVAAAPAAAHRPSADSDEPSFVPNLDQVALAAILIAAALVGAAFCDECTRSSRAA